MTISIPSVRPVSTGDKRARGSLFLYIGSLILAVGVTLSEVAAAQSGGTQPLSSGRRKLVFCGTPKPPCNPSVLGTPCYKPPPPKPKCEPTDCNKCTKSPCYVGTGVYASDVLDLQLPTAGSSLIASRHYVSTQAIDGPLGYGWTSSLNVRLYYATYLFAGPSTYQKEADIRMPDGAFYRFVENADGTFTPPQGRKDTLRKNADGSFDLTIQRSRSVLHFGTNGSLQFLQDDYGNRIDYVYDTGGILQRVADASGSGRYLDVTFGPDGRISSIQDSAGRVVLYTYTLQGALRAVTDPAGRVTSYSYQTGLYSPLLSQIRDNWSRVISDIAFDATDRVLSYTEAGETYTYTYSYLGNAAVTAKTDASGNRWVYPFAGDGLVSDTQPPADVGGSAHTDYYSDGSVQRNTDNVGIKTYYTYTPNGSPLTITRNEQGSPSVRFDYAYDLSFPEKVISITPKDPSTNAVLPDWQAWQYDYYQAGDPAPGALHHEYRVRSDGTLETLATYAYDSHGRITRQTSATGAATDYFYNAQGNMQTVTAPANNDAGLRSATTYSDYDAVGRARTVTDPLSHATTYTYDPLGRVLTVTLPKPSTSSSLAFTTTYAYDNFDSASGLLFSHVTDPNTKVMTLGYDQFGRLVKTTDPAGNMTTGAYSHGLRSSITDANGNVTSYYYDGGRRLKLTKFPDNSSEAYTYFADGLLLSKTDRKSHQITYSYDPFKRLAWKTYPDSTTITYTYTGQELTQVVDTSVTPNETHTFTYDSSYRMMGNSQASRGTVAYTFTPEDRLASMSIASGPTTTYAYYPDGSLDTIAWSPVSSQFKYTYDLSGLYQQITLPNGQRRDYTLDDQGRLLQLANIGPASQNLATYAYGYDVDSTTGLSTMLGERTSMTATVPSQGFTNALTKYSYDPLYRLTKVNYPGVAPFNAEVDQWTYDAIGNRLTSTVNGVSQTYTYFKNGTNPLNGRRLQSDGVNAYGYDSNGNTLTRTGAPSSFAFGYDFDNRLTSISGSATAAYAYDFQGRRTSKTVGGTTSSYLYDGLNLVAETGSSVTHYVFGPRIDEPLAGYRNGVIAYFAVDGFGSVVIENDPSATVNRSTILDAWGGTPAETGTRMSPFTFTGREVGEAGLLFHRARLLDSARGRFLQEEPGDPDEVAAAAWLRLFGPLQPRVSTARLAAVRLGRPDPRQPGINYSDHGYLYGDDSPILFSDPTGALAVPRWLKILIDLNHVYEFFECGDEFLGCRAETQKRCLCDAQSEAPSWRLAEVCIADGLWDCNFAWAWCMKGSFLTAMGLHFLEHYVP